MRVLGLPVLLLALPVAIHAQLDAYLAQHAANVVNPIAGLQDSSSLSPDDVLERVDAAKEELDMVSDLLHHQQDFQPYDGAYGPRRVIERRFYEEIAPELETGDVVLSLGRAALSATICELTKSYFSHIGMVVKLKDLWKKERLDLLKERFVGGLGDEGLEAYKKFIDEPMILESDYGYEYSRMRDPTRDVMMCALGERNRRICDKWKEDESNGITVNRLQAKLFEYEEDGQLEAKDYAVRRLVFEENGEQKRGLSSSQLARLRDFYEQSKCKRFQLEMSFFLSSPMTRSLKKVLDSVKDRNTDRNYFCSNYVARAYQAMGILDFAEDAEDFTPKDFTSDAGDSSVVKHMSLGYNYLQEDWFNMTALVDGSHPVALNPGIPHFDRHGKKVCKLAKSSIVLGGMANVATKPLSGVRVGAAKGDDYSELGHNIEEVTCSPQRRQDLVNCVDIITNLVCQHSDLSRVPKRDWQAIIDDQRSRRTRRASTIDKMSLVMVRKFSARDDQEKSQSLVGGWIRTLLGGSTMNFQPLSDQLSSCPSEMKKFPRSSNSQWLQTKSNLPCPPETLCSHMFRALEPCLAESSPKPTFLSCWHNSPSDSVGDDSAQHEHSGSDE